MFNREAEQSVLGAILLEKSIEVLDGINLQSFHFYEKHHQIIYLCIRKLEKANLPIDIITLIEELRRNNNLDLIGGISYLTSLTTIVPSSSNAKYYADIVFRLAQKRKLALNLEETLKNLEKLDETTLSIALDEAKNIVDNSQQYESMFSDFSQIKSIKHTKSLSSGFQKLDKATHGLEYGTLTILTGEPSSGKSTLLNQIIANTLMNKEKVFLYSGELNQEKLKQWFNHTVANKEDLIVVTDEHGEKIQITADKEQVIDEWTRNQLFVFNDDEKPSESNLIGTITYLVKQKGIRLVVLDNLMTMIVENLKDEYQRQKYLVNNLKNLAKKFDLVIILVAHVNKESAKNDFPNMFEVSGASEIVNLADYVFKIKKESVLIKGQEEFINDIYILKNRITGLQGVYLRVFFDSFRKRFYTEDKLELKVNYRSCTKNN